MTIVAQPKEVPSATVQCSRCRVIVPANLVSLPYRCIDKECPFKEKTDK